MKGGECASLRLPAISIHFHLVNLTNLINFMNFPTLQPYILFYVCFFSVT